eukprot:COSAG06_NODE_5020_length_3786_cov_156.246813_5_plen_64_part_00
MSAALNLALCYGSGAPAAAAAPPDWPSAAHFSGDTRYNREEDWDEIAMFALHAPNQSPGVSLS